MPATLEPHLNVLLDEVDLLAAGVRRLGNSQMASTSLSLPGRAVLELIASQPNLTVPQIARLRDSSRQNVQVIVDRMAGLGLIEFVPNPAHQRSDCLTITELGRQVLRKAPRSHAATLLETLPNLNAEELHASAKLLSRIRGSLGLSTAMQTATTLNPRRKRRSSSVSASDEVVTEESAPREEVVANDASPEELPVSLL